MTKTFYFVLSLLFILSCSSEDKKYEVQVEGRKLSVVLVHGQPNYLRCYDGDSLSSSWPLRFPVFKFLKGDINGDGQDDIALGVFKTTRRDTVARKRLFLFQIKNKTIIPLWLGSSLGHPLEDFSLRQLDSVMVVRSMEREQSGKYLIADYVWFGFGLSFKEYLMRESSYSEAQSFLLH